MKHTSKSSLYAFFAYSLMFLSCWNGSLVESDQKSKRPDINFYGNIEDHHASFNFVDLLIGRKYEDIVVYQPIKRGKKRTIEGEIKEQEIDPRQNKTLLDLHEIKTIELKHPDHPTASKIEINNKDFTEIVVTSINGTKKHYLIESNRKITCRSVDKGPSGDKKTVFEERELNMIHIKKLTIKGYKSVREEPEKRYYEDKSVNVKHEDEPKTEPVKIDTPKMSDDKKEVAKTTEKIIDQLHENVKNLSTENPTAFEAIKKSMIGLLKSLREQLQKILNMLQ